MAHFIMFVIPTGRFGQSVKAVTAEISSSPTTMATFHYLLDEYLISEAPKLNSEEGILLPSMEETYSSDIKRVVYLFYNKSYGVE